MAEITRYTKEIGLFQQRAIKEGLEAAGQTASKYITRIDSSGIYIKPENNTDPRIGVEGNSIRLNGEGLEIFKNSNSVAFYGENVRIGKENYSRILIDSNSLKLYYGSENVPYVMFADFRNEQGITIVEDYFYINNDTAGTFDKQFELSHEATNIIYVKINSEETLGPDSSRLEPNGKYLKIIGLEDGDEILVRYKTQDPVRYYTFGSRDSRSSGSNSLTVGVNCAASGNNAIAFGKNSSAFSDNSLAIGESSQVFGGRSVAGGYSSISNAMDSFAFGRGAYSNQQAQVAIGRYNEIDYGGSSIWGKYALIIGNGSGPSNRSNALAIGWNGSIDSTNYAMTSEGDLFLSGLLQIKKKNPGGLQIEVIDEKAGDIHTLSADDIGAAFEEHSHGNINTLGRMSDTSVTTDQYDSLIIRDISDNGTLTNGPTFGNSGYTFLANNGTWICPIASIVTDDASYTSLATGTDTNIYDFTVPPGRWHLDIVVRFPANATGYREIHLANSSGTSLGILYTDTRSAVSGRVSYTHISAPYQVSSSTPLKLYAIQNSGSAMGTSDNPIYVRFSRYGLAF